MTPHNRKIILSALDAAALYLGKPQCHSEQGQATIEKVQRAIRVMRKKGKR